MATSEAMTNQVNMPFFAMCRGEKPSIINVMAAAKTMPTKFVVKSRNAIKNICHSPQPKPIPATAMGGTRCNGYGNTC